MHNGHHCCRRSPGPLARREAPRGSVTFSAATARRPFPDDSVADGLRSVNCLVSRGHAQRSPIAAGGHRRGGKDLSPRWGLRAGGCSRTPGLTPPGYNSVGSPSLTRRGVDSRTERGCGLRPQPTPPLYWGGVASGRSTSPHLPRQCGLTCFHIFSHALRGLHRRCEALMARAQGGVAVWYNQAAG